MTIKNQGNNRRFGISWSYCLGKYLGQLKFAYSEQSLAKLRNTLVSFKSGCHKFLAFVHQTIELIPDPKMTRSISGVLTPCPR